MASQALAAWLQLSLTPGLRAATLRELLHRFRLPESVIAGSRRTLSEFLPPDVLDAMHSERVMQGVSQALQWSNANNRSIIAWDHPEYPKALLETSDPPALLYCEGRTELLNRPALAIVGSRNATAQGVRNAHAFSCALSDAGLTIISGLALGIDAAAHRGGLEGRSSTIAVLGTGADVVYPPTNRALAREIAERGLLLSELPLGSPPAKQNFPRRNRIISGLARGTLVVEAALSSGSLITARAALEQGREVFAIPGSIHSPLSKGCHSLIKSGAKLVESADDVLSELGAVAPAPQSPAVPRESEVPFLLDQMGFDPIDIDSLCARIGRSAQEVTAELLRLELEGRIASLPGGLYQRLQ